MRKALLTIGLFAFLAVLCATPSYAAPVVGIRSGFPGGLELEIPMGERLSVFGACSFELGYIMNHLEFDLLRWGCGIRYRFGAPIAEGVQPFVSLAGGAFRIDMNPDPIIEEFFYVPTGGGSLGLEAYLWDHWRTAIEAGFVLKFHPDGFIVSIQYGFSLGYRY